MRKKKDVMHELDQAVKRMNELSADPKGDEFRSAVERVQALTDELNSINVSEAAERAVATAAAEQKDAKELIQRFSFTKFIREAAGENGDKLTGVESEVAQLGAEEAKKNGVVLRGVAIPSVVLNGHRAVANLTDTTYDGQNATTSADGGVLIQSSMQYQEALRNRLVLARAGATYMSGLRGNLDLIQGSGVTMGWLEENEKGEDQKMTFSKRSVGPMRCFVNVPVSRQLAIQSSLDVDRLVMTEIMAAHAELIEDAALNGSGTDEPTGILSTTGIGNIALGTNGGVPTFGTMVDLETEIALQNADSASMAYITNNKIRGYLKQTLIAQGVPGFILNGNEINGYPAYATNILPSNLVKGTANNASPIIFGDWSNLWILGWGGLDFIVDPYSLKKFGAYEITLNAYHNIFVKQPKAFAAVKDALTAVPATTTESAGN